MVQKRRNDVFIRFPTEIAVIRFQTVGYPQNRRVLTNELHSWTCWNVYFVLVCMYKGLLIKHCFFLHSLFTNRWSAFAARRIRAVRRRVPMGRLPPRRLPAFPARPFSTKLKIWVSYTINQHLAIWNPVWKLCCQSCHRRVRSTPTYRIRYVSPRQAHFTANRTPTAGTDNVSESTFLLFSYFNHFLSYNGHADLHTISMLYINFRVPCCVIVRSLLLLGSFFFLGRTVFRDGFFFF